jgi:hypothetical protein
MSLVDDSLRAVSIEKVDSEEECFREELESSVSLDEEVDEVRSHEPLNLLLDINRCNIRKSLILKESQ